MAVHERQNSAVHRTRVKQRWSRGEPEVATVSLARGVFGGDWRTKTETEQEQSNAGEFPKTLTLSVHWYHAYPWTQTYNSLYLSLNTFSSRPFQPSNLNHYARISFFLFCTTSFFPWAPFLETNIYVIKYHQNSLFYNFTSKSDAYMNQSTSILMYTSTLWIYLVEIERERAREIEIETKRERCIKKLILYLSVLLQQRVENPKIIQHILIYSTLKLPRPCVETRQRILGWASWAPAAEIIRASALISQSEHVR